MASVRMDKWLWAARFFKTRALAVRACELGRIASNGQLAKPSRDVRIGDRPVVIDYGDRQRLAVPRTIDGRRPDDDQLRAAMQLCRQKLLRGALRCFRRRLLLPHHERARIRAQQLFQPVVADLRAADADELNALEVRDEPHPRVRYRGAVEEASQAEIRELFDTNFFGLVAVTQAVLPQ